VMSHWDSLSAAKRSPWNCHPAIHLRQDCVISGTAGEGVVMAGPVGARVFVWSRRGCARAVSPGSQESHAFSALAVSLTSRLPVCRHSTFWYLSQRFVSPADCPGDLLVCVTLNRISSMNVLIGWQFPEKVGDREIARQGCGMPGSTEKLLLCPSSDTLIQHCQG
jgi:hypothetical protein